MKNQYSFELLAEKEIYSAPDRNKLFFAMFDFIMRRKDFSVINAADLQSALPTCRYYVAHNLVSYKGNTPTFKGELVTATRPGLLDFIRKSIELDDLRDLLISPVFVATPDEYVLSVQEDIFYFYS